MFGNLIHRFKRSGDNKVEETPCASSELSSPKDQQEDAKYAVLTSSPGTVPTAKVSETRRGLVERNRVLETNDPRAVSTATAPSEIEVAKPAEARRPTTKANIFRIQTTTTSHRIETGTPTQKRRSTSSTSADFVSRGYARMKNDREVDARPRLLSSTSKVQDIATTHATLGTRSSISRSSINYITGEPGQPVLGSIPVTRPIVERTGRETMASPNAGRSQQTGTRSNVGGSGSSGFSMKTWPRSILKKSTTKNSMSETESVQCSTQRNSTPRNRVEIFPAETWPSQLSSPRTALHSRTRGGAKDGGVVGTSYRRDSVDQVRSTIASPIVSSEGQMTLEEAKRNYDQIQSPEIRRKMLELSFKLNVASGSSGQNDREEDWEIIREPLSHVRLETGSSSEACRARHVECRENMPQKDAAKTRSISFSSTTAGELEEPLKDFQAKATKKQDRPNGLSKAFNELHYLKAKEEWIRRMVSSRNSQSSSKEDSDEWQSETGSEQSLSEQVNSNISKSMSAVRYHPSEQRGSSPSRTLPQPYSTTRHSSTSSTLQERKSSSTSNTKFSESDSHRQGTYWSGGPLKTVLETLQLGPVNAECLKCPFHCEAKAIRNSSPELAQAVENLVDWFSELQQIEHKIGVAAEAEECLGDAARLQREMNISANGADPLGECCEEILSKPRDEERDFAFWGSATRYMSILHAERLRTEINRISKNGWDEWGCRSLSRAEQIPWVENSDVECDEVVVAKRRLKGALCRCVSM